MIKGDQSGKIAIWSMANSSLIKSWVAHDKAVTDLTLIVDEQLLASSSYDLTIKLWNFITFSLVSTLKGHSNIVYGLKLVFTNSNSKVLLSTSFDNTIKSWNITTTGSHLINTFKGHTDLLISFDSISVDTIVSGSYDRTIRVWQLSTAKQLRSIITDTTINALVVL